MKETRWEQRFENFEKAYNVLNRTIENYNDNINSKLNESLMLAIIQAFEITVEVAWKTFGDYLINQGRDITSFSSKHVLREAYEVELIDDGQIWLEMIEVRNRTSHEYNEHQFIEAVNLIINEYTTAFKSVCALKDRT